MINEIRSLFMWCSVINIAALMLWFCLYVFAGDLMYKYHSKWFFMSREKFNIIHYSGMGLYKLAICMFNVVPYIALLIAG
ncbi:MAG: hypothetical protein P9M03_11160 [Candidatus Theseobacter exili]|nr:hypothetical protein [Candidatus Theseobacter exili]